jgi:hypothetical protein
VVDDEVHDDTDSAAVRLVEEFDEVAERAVARVDAVVVGDVVAVVAVRRRLEGTEPQSVDAEALQVVEPSAQPFEAPQPSPSLSWNVSRSRL